MKSDEFMPLYLIYKDGNVYVWKLISSITGLFGSNENGVSEC